MERSLLSLDWFVPAAKNIPDLALFPKLRTYFLYIDNDTGQQYTYSSRFSVRGDTSALLKLRVLREPTVQMKHFGSERCADTSLLRLERALLGRLRCTGGANGVACVPTIFVRPTKCRSYWADLRDDFGHLRALRLQLVHLLLAPALMPVTVQRPNSVRSHIPRSVSISASCPLGRAAFSSKVSRRRPFF